MSHQSIRTIRDAEDQAALLCRVASERAEEMRARVRAEGEAHYAETISAAEEEYAATLAEIRQRATAVKEKKRAEALREADELIAAAREKSEAAVSLIVWEIIERCQ